MPSVALSRCRGGGQGPEQASLTLWKICALEAASSSLLSRCLGILAHFHSVSCSSSCGSERGLLTVTVLFPVSLSGWAPMGEAY